jgi:uncharacterized membrane protein YsdA (DUF1294 family)
MRNRAHRTLRPEWFHGGVALLLALAATAALLHLTGSSPTAGHTVLAWLAGINLTAFVYYGYDKYQSRRTGPRVPEAVLHGLALAGGSGGAYAGMHFFRHKTLKGRFRLIFWGIVVLQAGLVAWVGYAVWRQHAA